MSPSTSRPGVVVVTGWPGAGKSTIAERLAVELDAAIVSHDWMLSALRAHGDIWDAIGEPWPRVREVGWVLMARVLEQQLQIRRSCVLDLVARPDAIAMFQTIADRHRARLDVVECTCSDEAVHRSRVEGRTRSIPGWPELTWEQVIGSRAHYVPIDGRTCALDAVDTVDHNVELVRRHLEHVGQ